MEIIVKCPLVKKAEIRWGSCCRTRGGLLLVAVVVVHDERWVMMSMVTAERNTIPYELILLLVMM